MANVNRRATIIAVGDGDSPSAALLGMAIDVHGDMQSRRFRMATQLLQSQRSGQGKVVQQDLPATILVDGDEGISRDCSLS